MTQNSSHKLVMVYPGDEPLLAMRFWCRSNMRGRWWTSVDQDRKKVTWWFKTSSDLTLFTLTHG